MAGRKWNKSVLLVQRFGDAIDRAGRRSAPTPGADKPPD